jgi:branched-chain amino acid transport system substrate-binding protein
MYCLAPTIHPARGGYVFSASTSMQDDLSALLRYFRLRGWKRIGFITTTDAGGQELERSLDNALGFRENAGVTITGREHFNALDISAGAQLLRLKATNPQALIAWATGTPTGTLLRGIHDAGIDVPIGAGNGNMTYAQMKQYADILPQQLYFPGLAPLSRGAVGKGPIADQQSIYFGAFKAIGLRPDYSNTLPWDAILVVVDALRHLGPAATSTQIRDYIMNLHGWAGTQGMYDFGDREQRGIGLNAVVVDRWDVASDDFIAVSRPGGYPK